MKILSIARKTLIEYVREPLLLGLVFAFPIMILGFYDIAFGETDQGLSKYLTVGVVNQDAGVMTAEGKHWQAGAQLTGLMREIKWEGVSIFDVSVVSDARVANIALREHKLSLLLTLPNDFSQALLDSAIGAQNSESGPPAVISLAGDPTSDNYVFAHSLVSVLVRQFARHAVDWLHKPVSQDTLWQSLEDAQTSVTFEFLSANDTTSDFDYGVPGMIVFGIMFVTVSTAMTLVRENVSGTLRRLRLTQVGAKDLLLGIALAQMALALAMVPITFGAAVVMGFRSQGSLLLATGIGLLLSLSAVGLGLITACFARNDGEAANLAATIGVLMVIVSGAMYPMPDVPIATIGDHTLQAYDLLPTAHAAEAMRKVLISGKGLSNIGTELAALTLLAALNLAIGVVLYQRMQLQGRRANP